MRWSSLFASFTLLAAGAFAAKKSPADRYEEFHAKSLKSSPFKLDDASYKKLTTAPRDYTVGVLLTAMDARFGCQLCREFQPEWDLLGRTWTKGDKPGESRMLFGTLDFSDGRETFMSVSNWKIHHEGLQSSGADNALHSLVYKLHRFSSSSNLLPALTLCLTPSHCVMISRTGPSHVRIMLEKCTC